MSQSSSSQLDNKTLNSLAEIIVKQLDARFSKIEARLDGIEKRITARTEEADPGKIPISDLTNFQVLLLKLLSDSEGPLSVYDLEKQLEKSRPYLTNHLNELVRQGLVEKRRNLEALGKTRDNKQPRPRYVFKAAVDDDVMKDSMTVG